MAAAAAGGEIGWRLYNNAGVMTVDARLSPQLGRWTLAFYVVVLAAAVVTSDVAAKLQASETRGDRGAAVMATVASIGILGWMLFERTRCGLIIGCAGAALGFLVEAVIVGQGWNHYAATLQHVAGIPIWVPAIHFSFGLAISQWTRAIDAAFRRDR